MNISSFQTFLTTSHLHNYVKNLYNKEIKMENDPSPEKDQFALDFHIQEQRFDCLAGLDLQKYIICAFAKNNEMDCSIKIISYRKKDGLKQSFTLSEINHNISCMTFMMTINQSQVKTDNPKTAYKLIVGFKEGFVKIINLANKAIISGLRTDVKPIVKIIGGDYERFKQNNICLALGEDYHIYLINVDTAQVVLILRPNIIMCDRALSIQINHQYSYLMETTHGGYIIFWNMTDILKRFHKKDKKGKVKSQAREYYLFPARINHSLAVGGLIWCAFYGHMIALITKAGDTADLKLVAINIKAEDEYMVLLNFKLYHPEKITYVNIYPQSDTIFIAKSKTVQCYLQQFKIGDDLIISKRVKITTKNMDALYQFYLPQNSPVIVCRGHNKFGVCHSQKLFQRSADDYQMQEEKDY